VTVCGCDAGAVVGGLRWEVAGSEDMADRGGGVVIAGIGGDYAGRAGWGAFSPWGDWEECGSLCAAFSVSIETVSLLHLISRL